MIDKHFSCISEYKKLRYINDVDASLSIFENNFFNTYANLLPKVVAVDKTFLIKNVLPLYLSKGNEKSFKYLFRLLFDQEVEVKYLRDNILKTSASQWIKENSINVEATDIFSIYDCDGEKIVFDIIDNYSNTNVQVFQKDANSASYTLITDGFEVHESYKKIIFDVPPPNRSKIKVVYNNVNKDLFVNREVKGNKSGASAIVEKTSYQLINGRLVIKLFVSNKTVRGVFSIGETVSISTFVSAEEVVDVFFNTISELKNIQIIDGGANYNVGDPVVIVSPKSNRDAIATVEKVFYPQIEGIQIVDGGAGFQLGSFVSIDEFTLPLVNMTVVSVSTQRTAGDFTVFSDVISDIDPANTLISATDYGFSVPNCNIASDIYSSFSEITYNNIGEINLIEINFLQYPFLTSPVFDVLPAIVEIPNISFTTTNTIVSIDTFGSLGKIVVLDGGENYSVGDEIVFTNFPGSLGIGAEAEVTSVDANGSITQVLFVPAKITGTVNVNAVVANTSVIGTGTLFTSELKVGDQIMIERNTKIISDISSDTTLNVTTAFGDSFNDKPIRFYGKYPVGGQGYTQDKLPVISVNSINGTDASIKVTAIMGAGDVIEANTTPLNGRKVGQIEKIKIVDSGKGFVTSPEIILSSSGSGNAIAQAILYPTVQQYSGKWLTTDSLLSSSVTKLEGLNYYIDYSYSISSQTQSVDYKNVVKDLLHPSGYIRYSEFRKESELNSANISVGTVLIVE